jgi:hypothetical protein
MLRQQKKNLASRAAAAAFARFGAAALPLLPIRFRFRSDSFTLSRDGARE